MPDDSTEVIAASFLRGLRWATVAITLIVLFGLQLPILLTERDSYTSFAVQLLAFAVCTAVALVGAALTALRRDLGVARWPLAVAVLAASVAANAGVAPQDQFGVVHWSIGTVGWPLVLLSIGRGIGVLGGLLAAHYCTAVAQVLVGGEVSVSVSEVVNVIAITASFHLSVGVFGIMIRDLATAAATTAAEQERLRTEEAVAEQLHADRRERYAALAGSVAPLLSGLATGTLDPADEAVRRACAVEAARMRRLFAEDPAAPDPLLNELRACVELAERNGVAVRFAERGERPPLSRQARRLLTEPAVAALATAKSTARLTVVGRDGTVTVSAVADAPADAVPTVDTDGVTTSTVVTGDRIWVEATWRPT